MMDLEISGIVDFRNCRLRSDEDTRVRGEGNIVGGESVCGEGGWMLSMRDRDAQKGRTERWLMEEE
jgi:hypothetical protein